MIRRTLRYSRCLLVSVVCIGNLKYLVLLETVRDNCRGSSRDRLETLCKKLPEERCLPGDIGDDDKCSKEEFSCGDGKCIHGLEICDNKYQCKSGYDELSW